MKFNIRGSAQKSACTSVNTNIERLSEKNAAKLMDELAVQMDAGADTDTIDAYLEVLDEKAPVFPDFNAATALEEFKANHPLIFVEKAKKRSTHRPLRRLALIAAIIAAIFAIMLVAQAAGVNIFGRIGEWTDEIFSFRRTNATSEAIKELKVELGELDYDTLSLPQWLPKGFELVESHFDDNSAAMSVSAAFQNGEKYLTISAVAITNVENAVAYEKDSDPVDVYENAGNEFYIMTNLNWQVACWADGKYEYTVGGEIEREELIDILNSI